MDYQFSPANPTVTVGDTIRFDFVQGFHNVTAAGNALPAGAADLYSGAPAIAPFTYDYKVAVAGSYNYYCQVNGAAKGSGMSASFTGTNPLPLTLGLFTASMSTDKSVKVYWKTYNESNVEKFSLKRSTDAIHFTEITSVPAQDKNEQEYSYTDKDLLSAKYVFYQLTVNDLNGSKTYSNIITMKNTASVGSLVTKCGPNPLTPADPLVVQFNAETLGAMDVGVYNMDGKMVTSAKMQAFPGLNNGYLHINYLEPGNYTLIFNYENKVEARSIAIH